MAMEPTPKRITFFLAVLLLSASAAFAFFPAYLVSERVGEQWQGVPPEFVTDSLYYYAQMREVADGHPLIGNPYFFEHRDGVAPAFFIPVDIAALPLMLGIPLSFTIVFNIFFWSAVFLYLSYQLLRVLELPRIVGLLGSLLMYLGSYMFMVRPVAMQIIFPAFLFFLLALLRWIRNPNRTNSVWLAVAVGLAPYTYTYLAYIVVFAMVGAFLWYLQNRRMHEVRMLIGVGVGALALAVPYIKWTLLPQILHPEYSETATRIGLVFTRIPANEFFYYGRWVVLVLIVVALLRFGEGRIREVTNAPLAHFFLFSGFGLLAAAGSNILTGTELSLAIHIGRFILLWFALSLAYLATFWFRERATWYSPNSLAALILILIGMASLVRNVPRSLAFRTPDPTVTSALEIQSYAEPLRWLAVNAPGDSVVWSNDELAAYVPILTPDYVLFAQAGNLQLASDAEISDRYLLSRMGMTTKESLVRDLAKYSGAGLGKEQPIAQNREVAWCTRLHALFPGKVCGTPTDGETLAGDAYFTELSVRADYLMMHRAEMLNGFKVRYLLLDTKNDPPFETFGLRGDILFENGRFRIYGLNFE